MRIAREGYPLILTVGALAVVAFVLGWEFVGSLLVLVTVAVAGFFRDPERIIPAGENLIVAPADGKVVSIAPANDGDMFSGSATRISLVLSSLVWHTNRLLSPGNSDECTYQ